MIRYNRLRICTSGVICFYRGLFKLTQICYPYGNLLHHF